MNTLKIEDRVIFQVNGKTLQYRVTGRTRPFLAIEEGGSLNSTIFSELGVEKYDYVEKIIGYRPHSGGFPEVYNLEDLTKVVEALQADCEKRNTTQKITERIEKELDYITVTFGEDWCPCTEEKEEESTSEIKIPSHTKTIFKNLI